MILIGENLNIMVKKIGQAMKERDPKPIQELAAAEAEAGVDYIDINLGPARKGGEELMAWMVKTVQEAIGELGIRATVKRVGCVGMCHQTPLVELVCPDRPTALYARVQPADARRIVQRHMRHDGRPHLCRRSRRNMPCRDSVPPRPH